MTLSELLNSQKPVKSRDQIACVMLLAWPAILEQIMITMVQYVDTAMVGSLGYQATASVGLTASTIWLFNGFLNASGVGFSVQVAHRIGAGDTEGARDVTRQSVLYNLFFGLLIGLVAFFLSFPLPGLLGADPAIAQDASAYFRIIGISMPFLLTSSLFSSILRCAGDTKTPMILNMLINVFNIILNTLLIYPSRTVALLGHEFSMWGAGLGVTGAAIGSALSAAIVGILLLLAVYLKKSPVRIRLGEQYRFTKKRLSQAAALGIPVALERSTLCIAQIVITILISRLGAVSIAANHLAVTAEALSYLPGYGIAAAATTLVGQSIGAERPELAVRFSRISTYIGMVMMTLTGVLLYIFSPTLMGLFTKDPEVIRLGTTVLRIESFAQPMFAASIIITGALRGAGDSRYPFLINLVSMWGVRLSIAAVITSRVGLVGVWIAMCTELWVRGFIFLYRLYSNKWITAMHKC